MIACLSLGGLPVCEGLRARRIAGGGSRTLPLPQQHCFRAVCQVNGYHARPTSACGAEPPRRGRPRGILRQLRRKRCQFRIRIKIIHLHRQAVAIFRHGSKVVIAGLGALFRVVEVRRVGRPCAVRPPAALAALVPQLRAILRCNSLTFTQCCSGGKVSSTFVAAGVALTLCSVTPSCSTGVLIVRTPASLTSGIVNVSV